MALKPIQKLVIQDGGDNYVMYSPFGDIIEVYVPGKSYTYDNYVYYSASGSIDGKLYRCIYDMGSSPDSTWNSAHWLEVSSITEELGYVRGKLYEAIKFSSFSMSPSTALMGNTVSALEFNYSLNKDPVTMKLNNTTITYDSVNHKYNQNGTWTKDTSSANRTYKMWAKDERNAEANTSNAVLNFYNYIYWGAAAVPSNTSNINSAFVNSLPSTTTGNKTISNSKGRTITVNGGAVGGGIHIFYTIPSRLGTCTFTSGGFTGGFSNSVLVDVTNDATTPYTEQYRVYWSDNDGLGSTTLIIA